MIIVISSIKGGTGKSTLSFNIATQAFLKNYKIATYDLDFPQYSFTRYYENRKNNKELKIWENHYHYQKISDSTKFDNSEVIHIIDTPGKYDEEMISLHNKADIIITPINDSFIDINTIMNIENERWSTLGSYYQLIYDAKNINEKLHWFVVKNRTSPIISKHSKKIEEQLKDLAKKLNFQLIQGPKDRNVFKELFNIGSTVLDIKTKLSISNLAAKIEIQSLWKKIENKIKH